MNANCPLTRVRIRVSILLLSETAWSAQARRFCKLKATLFFVPVIKKPAWNATRTSDNPILDTVKIEFGHDRGASAKPDRAELPDEFYMDNRVKKPPCS